MTAAHSPLDVIRWIGTERFDALTDADRAELGRLQVEIDACVAKIQAMQVPWIPSEDSEP